ncbi:F-box only protein 4-like [Haliotis cracherodii]|uniref:F-box only protein 4-like n=1 Tax=Haliotis cracherodii TaxID=6455 RepID=UPI0039E9A58D
MMSVAHMPCTVTSQPSQEPIFSHEYQDETVLDAEISNVLNSVKDLLKKYRMYSKAAESSVVSGGLQQYLIRQLKRKNVTPDKSTLERLQALYLKDSSTVHMLPDSVYNNENENNTPRFNRLPVNLKLHIFSFLDAQGLCQASRVCRGWCQLTSDALLWQRRLKADLPKWDVLSHTANPKLYQETESELTDKEVYFKCSPEVQQCQRQELSTFHQVSQVLKSFLPKKAPRVAMFGPGLETNTSSIVRKMLYEDNETFQRIAMFPGQFEGMGAGMTMKLPSGNNFHLTVLYTATKREREMTQNRDRLATNKLLSKQKQNQDGSDSETYELQQSIKDLCHTLDAFVFVVDASCSAETVESSKRELFAMINERWLAPYVPVLVLSCIPESSSHRLPASDVVLALDLCELNRPWLVRDAVVDSLSGVEKGIQWIVDQSQHK